jgi:hypothetical protein
VAEVALLVVLDVGVNEQIHDATVLRAEPDKSTKQSRPPTKSKPKIKYKSNATQRMEQIPVNF